MHLYSVNVSINNDCFQISTKSTNTFTNHFFGIQFFFFQSWSLRWFKRKSVRTEKNVVCWLKAVFEKERNKKNKQTERKKIKIEKDKSNRRNCGPIERACLRSIDVCKSFWITYLTSYWAACSRVPLSFSTIFTKFWYTQSRLRFFLYVFIPSKLGWLASCLYCCTDTHAYWEEKKKYYNSSNSGSIIIDRSIFCVKK